jgi:hypothetical protein
MDLKFKPYEQVKLSEFLNSQLDYSAWSFGDNFYFQRPQIENSASPSDSIAAKEDDDKSHSNNNNNNLTLFERIAENFLFSKEDKIFELCLKLEEISQTKTNFSGFKFKIIDFWSPSSSSSPKIFLDECVDSAKYSMSQQSFKIIVDQLVMTLKKQETLSIIILNSMVQRRNLFSKSSRKYYTKITTVYDRNETGELNSIFLKYNSLAFDVNENNEVKVKELLSKSFA